MSALVAGYESSDDESPVASTSSRKLGNGASAAVEVDDEDDEKLEEQARVDAFGLSTQNGADQIQRTETKAIVKAAPEVLKEVCPASLAPLTTGP